MKRFIITSEKFSGQVELLYKNNTLAVIDFKQAILNDIQLRAIKNAAPVMEMNVPDAYSSFASITIVEGEIIVTLDDFIHEYPYKRNMHLLPARWDKMSQADKIEAVQSAKEYRAYCERNKQWYKPMIADTWLSKKEYKNNWKNL